jgi:hypothetical protein
MMILAVAVALIGACIYLAGKVSDWIDSGLEEIDNDGKS